MPIPDHREPVDGATGSLSETIFDRLVALILDGTLEQGERIRDMKIAEWLGVSRTPVREAITQLIRVGLVESEPSRFTRVTLVSDELIEKTFEYTGHVASLAVRMALAHMDDVELGKSVELLDAMIEASGKDDAPLLYQRSRAFIGYLTARTRNPVFIDVMRQTGLAAERNLRHRRPQIGTREERDAWYRELREGLLNRDVGRAEHAIRRQHGL